MWYISAKQQQWMQSYCPFVSSTAVSVSNHGALAQFCRDQEIRLVVVGPEVPLAAGKRKQAKNHSLHNLGRKVNFSPHLLCTAQQYLNVFNRNGNRSSLAVSLKFRVVLWWKLISEGYCVSNITVKISLGVCFLFKYLGLVKEVSKCFHIGTLTRVLIFLWNFYFLKQ